MRRFISFDIFDTCLCRICGNPHNIFFLLAREVLGDNACLSDLLDFKTERIRAEKRAIEKKESLNVNLEEIYEQCDFSGITSERKNDILKKELEIEERNLSPICHSLEIINSYRKNGNHIIYISDMYLPSPFLLKVLEKYGFWKNGDRLFVSCEENKSKAEGSLFKHISDKENISFSRWIHYGDNPIKDVINPKKLGIKGVHLDYSFSYYEKLLEESDISVDNYAISLSIGISRALRLSHNNDAKVGVAADFVAPLYVSFVNQVMMDARQKEITDLYFLARDGKILFEIAKELKPFYKTINIHYLYASRKAIYFPSISGINKENLDFLVDKDTTLPIQNRVDNLHIKLKKSFLDNNDYKEDLVGALLDNEEIRLELEKCLKVAKKTTLDYLKQEGLANNKNKCAIVDLRGTRKCQECLNALLEEEGYNRVLAYYLEVSTKSINPSHPGEYLSFVYGDVINHKSVFYPIKNKAFIFEQYFSATCDPRTASYTQKDGHVIPVFDELEYISSETKSIQDINTAICKDYARMMINSGLNNDTKIILQNTLKVISDFCVKPKLDYLKAFENLYVSKTQFDHTPIIKKINILDYVKNNTCIWFDGSMVYTYGDRLGILFNEYYWRIRNILKRFLRFSHQGKSKLS